MSSIYHQRSRALPHPNHTTSSSSSPPESSSLPSSSTTTPSITTSMIDGTWEINVYMEELEMRRVRVRGDLHVGGLMLKIVEGLEHERDWSDFAIWWPKRNKWLMKMRSTLDQYEIQAGTLLHFLPVHSHLYVQLPDLQIIQMKVDFSADLFSVVIRMCRQLGIRHPEELSLTLPLEKDDLKKQRGPFQVSRSKSQYDMLTSELNRSTSRDSINSTSSSHLQRSSNQSLPPGSAFLRDSFYGSRNSGRFSLRKRKSMNTLTRTISTQLSPGFADGTLTRNQTNTNSFLTRSSTGSLYPPPGHDVINSPWVSSREAFNVLLKPKNLAEKARCNGGWLDSSKSLMEQSVIPSSLVLLKFKFYSFYDLNPMNDPPRINQLYEQAKWSILTEEIDCTREEMTAFAALQLHIHQLQNPCSPGLHHDTTLTSKDHDYALCRTPEDIIDAALNDLQMALEGPTLNYSAPFSTRARSGVAVRSNSNSAAYDCSYPTINRHGNYSNGMPTTKSAYSISSSSSSHFFPSSSSSSRYDFNLSGVLGVGSHMDDHHLPSLIQDITKVPELKGNLRFYRPKRFFLKSYKKQPFMFKDLILSMFRAANDERPIWSLDLKGCEIVSEVLLSGRKYIIKLMVPSNRGADEIWFKMDDEDQYVNWLAGMKLACSGRTMADVPSFRSEVSSLREKMDMLRGGKQTDLQGYDTSVNNNGSKPNDYMNNGYDLVDPKSSPSMDVDVSTFSRRDSRRRSLLDRFRRDNSEHESRVNGSDTILRPKMNGKSKHPIRNGVGSSYQINAQSRDSEDELQNNGRTRSASSSDSVISIPKSMLDSKGILYGNMAPKDFIAPRFCRRSKLKQMLHKISEAVDELRDTTTVENKLAFIKAWQSLPDFGYSYFIIRIKGTKKEDVLVLTPSKIVLLDGGSHEVLERWRYQDLKSWSVNWEVRQVMIEFEEGELTFYCLSSDCKVIHEFIGGYIFLSMRSPEHNHKLNQELFHKLTGGWT